MNKESIISICIIVLLLSISFTGCMSNNKEDENNNTDNSGGGKVTTHFEIEIDTSSDNIFFTYLPAPLFAPTTYKNRISKILDDLEFTKGNGSYELEDTINGTALNISSNQSIKLIAHKEFLEDDWDQYREYTFAALTLTTDETKKGIQNIYFNSTVVNGYVLNFYCYSRIIHPLGSENFEWGINNYTLKQEWQKVKMFIDETIIN